LEVTFVLIRFEGAVRHNAVQGVHRTDKSLGVANLSEVSKRLLLQECADSSAFNA
jgi:hypothetical protein